jgi:hypothetical protein
MNMSLQVCYDAQKLHEDKNHKSIAVPVSKSSSSYSTALRAVILFVHLCASSFC